MDLYFRDVVKRRKKWSNVWKIWAFPVNTELHSLLVAKTDISVGRTPEDPIINLIYHNCCYFTLTLFTICLQHKWRVSHKHRYFRCDDFVLIYRVEITKSIVSFKSELLQNDKVEYFTIFIDAYDSYIFLTATNSFSTSKLYWKYYNCLSNIDSVGLIYSNSTNWSNPKMSLIYNYTKSF